MSKWTTRQKVAFFVCLGIVANILTIAGIGFFAYLTIFHCDYGRVYNDYVQYEDKYFSLEVTVEDIMYGEEYGKARGFVYVKSPWEEYFVICEPTYQMLLETDFLDIVDKDTVITIITHSYIAWDGWNRPIVGVTVGDKTYLDFETGKQNWLDWLKVRSEDVGFLQTPIKEQNN